MRDGIWNVLLFFGMISDAVSLVKQPQSPCRRGLTSASPFQQRPLGLQKDVNRYASLLTLVARSLLEECN